MNPAGHLLIRADAGEGYGTGHVMRSIAHGEAWTAKGGSATLLSASLPECLEQRLQQTDIEVEYIASVPGSIEDASETLARAREFGTSWILLDGYQFDRAYHHRLREGPKLIVVDDYCIVGGHDADLILDANPGAEPDDFAHSPANVLVGPAFAPLRSEFSQLDGMPATRVGEDAHLLLTLGGTPPQDLLSGLLGELIKRSGPVSRVTVPLGTTDPGDSLRPFQSNDRVTFLQGMQDFGRAVRSADLAISAAGSTWAELCFLGVPAIYVSIAENQLRVARALDEAGVGIDVGWHAETEPTTIVELANELLGQPSRLRALARAADNLVDGRGARRVLFQMRRQMVTLREATLDDAELLFAWANDPAVRQMSFSRDEIAWDEHVSWLRNKLMDPSVVIYIAEDHEGRGIGQVRLEGQNSRATISVSVDEAARGQGWGTVLIANGSTRCLETPGVHAVLAQIRPTNQASMRAFSKVGYEVSREIKIDGHAAVEMILETPPAFSAYV